MIQGFDYSAIFNFHCLHQERGILKELDQRKEEEKKPLVSKDEECNRATDVGHEGGEVSSMDMFWFFKPCTYLVK